MMFRSLSWPLVILAMLSTGLSSLHADQARAAGSAAGNDPGGNPAVAAHGSAKAFRDIVRVDVPEAWTYLPEQSRRLAESAMNQPPSGDVPVVTEVQAWSGDGAGLVVSWLETAVPAATPEVTARALLEQVRRAPARASLEPGDATPGSWNERMVDGMVDARMEWAHLRNGTTTLSRSVVFQTASGQVHMVRADCMLATDQSTGAAGGAADHAAGKPAPSQARSTCQHVLDSLTVVPPPAERRPLAALPSAAAEPASPAGAAARHGHASPTGDTGDTGDTGTPAFREPVMGNGVLVMQPSRGGDERSHQWLYVLGGILLVLAVYMTTRNRPSEREQPGAAARAGDEPGSEDDEERA